MVYNLLVLVDHCIFQYYMIHSWIWKFVLADRCIFHYHMVYNLIDHFGLDIDLEYNLDTHFYRI